jgi:hypothetical protein
VTWNCDLKSNNLSIKKSIVNNWKDSYNIVSKNVCYSVCFFCTAIISAPESDTVMRPVSLETVGPEGA